MAQRLEMRVNRPQRQVLKIVKGNQCNSYWILHDGFYYTDIYLLFKRSFCDSQCHLKLLKCPAIVAADGLAKQTQ